MANNNIEMYKYGLGKLGRGRYLARREGLVAAIAKSVSKYASTMLDWVRSAPFKYVKLIQFHHGFGSYLLKYAHCTHYIMSLFCTAQPKVDDNRPVVTGLRL